MLDQRALHATAEGLPNPIDARTLAAEVLRLQAELSSAHDIVLDAVSIFQDDRAAHVTEIRIQRWRDWLTTVRVVDPQCPCCVLLDECKQLLSNIRPSNLTDRVDIDILLAKLP